MDYAVFGLSHHTADIELRERAALQGDALDQAVEWLRDADVPEFLILSTCNRTEILTFGVAGEARDVVASVLARTAGVAEEIVSNVLRGDVGAEAVRHIMRVASGLDSMVLGEPQILGQFRQAIETAREYGTIGPRLDRLAQRTLAVAKRVRTETEIGRFTVSMASVAVDLAEEIFEPLSEKRVLVLGAGEMAEIAVAHFSSRGIGSMVICNRTIERARELASLYQATPEPLDRWPDELGRADIVLVGAGGGRLLGVSEVRRALKAAEARPRLIVDLGLPRAVDPEVAHLRDVFLYAVDDLQSMADRNLARRSAAAEQAEAIIDEAVVHFAEWVERQRIAPLLAALHQEVEAMRQRELRRSLRHRDELQPEELAEHATTAFARRLLRRIGAEANQSANQDAWIQVLGSLVESADSNGDDSDEAENRLA
ncbi:MAG: glutamyl-tRNA reductase [Candidatus Dadabacteria bacterium]|nr:MAG: glutamyl-tRNA reductase [Candidatus Dadabacteria bacterium]